MPPVPIYSSSPINAKKASGETPETRTEGLDKQSPGSPASSTQDAPTATSSQSYPHAQPGVAPSLPVPTGAVEKSHIPATPTQTLEAEDPPAPQPGATPVAPGNTSTLPPPPKAGETYHPPQQTTTAQPSARLPPQMSMQPPTASHTAQQGTSPSTTSPQATGTRPITLGASGSLTHPPGYHQNTEADTFSSHQRAAHQASAAEGGVLYAGDDNVWDQAKKWAQGVGTNIAAVENEVWKRINKD